MENTNNDNPVSTNDIEMQMPPANDQQTDEYVRVDNAENNVVAARPPTMCESACSCLLCLLMFGVIGGLITLVVLFGKKGDSDDNTRLTHCYRNGFGGYTCM